MVISSTDNCPCFGRTSRNIDFTSAISEFLDAVSSSLCDSCRNGYSLGKGGRKLFPCFRHDPFQKCQTQLPGRTGIFGAVNSCPPRNSNESLIDQLHFTSWNELSEMSIVLLDPTCSRWLLLHGDYFFKPTPFLTV